MGQATSGALTRGQSFHAGSRTVVSCLYTLQFCIVLLHATAAPLQYRPLSGSHRTDGARAVSVLTETITELALDAPQTSYAKLLDCSRDWLVLCVCGVLGYIPLVSSSTGTLMLISGGECSRAIMWQKSAKTHGL